LVGKDRIIQYAFDAGFKIAVDISSPQDISIHLSKDIDIFYQGDLAFCQRSCLIRTEDIHASEIRDSIEPFDDSSFGGHFYRSSGHIDAHDDWQQFRSDTHSDSQSEND
jgi:hypothetical protein